MTNVPELLSLTFSNATVALLNSRNAAGHWEGELSSSALSTATALFALRLSAERAPKVKGLISGGIDWLIRTQNPDGGWGDTVLSLSNISTTALCWAALTVAQSSHLCPDERDTGGTPVQPAIRLAEDWLKHAAGSLEPADLARAIRTRYGKDHTFSVPILTMCALAGRLGNGSSAWKHVPQLPFEFAACPHQWFARLRLRVVSYALPALIAIGQIRHARRPTWNPALRIVRRLTRNRTLRVLQQIQPPGGGFLEATPLTSFVVMSLAGCGLAEHPVAKAGVDFLIRSARPDGSWPIDTNLATWLTTLSVNALSITGFPAGSASRTSADALETVRSADPGLNEEDRKHIRDWLIAQQYRIEHPYTHAAPGAWAWTDLPGGVPDADDTAGALLALWNLGFRDAGVLDAVHAGIGWLLDLQNRDGGMPTFCRGWGHLPFDRSGCDLTAHALHALAVWRPSLPAALAARVDRAGAGAVSYLRKQQRADGSWIPLWFGNQFAPGDENPIYGTARIIPALCAHGLAADAMCRQAVEFLLAARNSDGSWGGRQRAGDGSIEETSLAIVALAACRSHGNSSHERLSESIASASDWLVQQTDVGQAFPPSPIGFYFANLWYYERQYPLIFACAALGAPSRGL